MSEFPKVMWKWDSYAKEPNRLLVVKETEHFITHQYMVKQWNLDIEKMSQSRISKDGVFASFEECKQARIEKFLKKISDHQDGIAYIQAKIAKTESVQEPTP